MDGFPVLRSMVLDASCLVSELANLFTYSFFLVDPANDPIDERAYAMYALRNKDSVLSDGNIGFGRIQSPY
jgi:hypothetical protein